MTLFARLGLALLSPALLTASLCGAPTDADADGVPAEEDCDDADPTVFPGAPEQCGDGIDQSCDGVADEGCAQAFALRWRASRIEIGASWLPEDEGQYEESFGGDDFDQLGPWSQSMEAVAGEMSAVGVQESDVSGSYLTARLDCRAAAPTETTSLGEAYAVSDMNVSFTLEEPTAVALFAQVLTETGADGGYPWAFVALRTPTGDDVLIDAEDGDRIVEEVLDLPAGTYELDASAYARVDLIQGRPVDLGAHGSVWVDLRPAP